MGRCYAKREYRARRKEPDSGSVFLPKTGSRSCFRATFRVEPGEVLRYHFCRREGSRMMKSGMTVYVVENGYFVHRARVLSAEGEICAVKKESGESRILAAGEFYLRREDAARAARQNEMQARDRDGRLRKVC